MGVGQLGVELEHVFHHLVAEESLMEKQAIFTHCPKGDATDIKLKIYIKDKYVGISCDIFLRGKKQGLTYDKLTLIQVMAYRKTSSIIRTKSQNLNVSHLALQLSLPNPLKPNVKLRMKM